MIDVAPSITLLQSCAMMYTQQVVPLTMDPLSLQGAFAAIQSSRSLNTLFKASVRPAAANDGPQKATRSKKFLLDFDPKCKAVEDYRIASDQLLEHLKGQLDGKQLRFETTQA